MEAQQLRVLAVPNREAEFSSQPPHGGSKTSLTLLSGDIMPSSDLLNHQEHMWCPFLHEANIHIHMRK